MSRLGLVLLGCVTAVWGQGAPKLPGDAELRQKLAGRWTEEPKSSSSILKIDHETFVLDAKGDYTKELKYILEQKVSTALSSGKWGITNGVITLSMTKMVMPDGEIKEPPKPVVSHLKVVSITERKLVVKDNISKSPQTLTR